MMWSSPPAALGRQQSRTSCKESFCRLCYRFSLRARSLHMSELRGFDTSKVALVYLRQSSPGQVRDNVVATEEQYRLREIPARYGFCSDKILVVDDDLGVSGVTIAGRKGMLRVLDMLER